MKWFLTISAIFLDIKPTGYPVPSTGYLLPSTGYPAGYRIVKKAGYSAGRISGATLHESSEDFVRIYIKVSIVDCIDHWKRCRQCLVNQDPPFN